MAQDLIFIDSRVADYQTLIAGLSADAEWVLLDAGQDGLLQMQKALSQYTELDSIQIISHGSAGALYLGSTVLTSENLDGHADILQMIGASLAPGGDLLLYGCDVAEGDTGAAFISRLAQLTGADVAASTNVTGAGGDWLLEAMTGEVTATSALLCPGSQTARTVAARESTASALMGPAPSWGANSWSTPTQQASSLMCGS